MNRFDKVALCAVVAVTLLYAARAVTVSDLYLRDATSPQWAAWFAGQFVVTYGPIAAAALCWRLSKRGRFGWAAHLLVLPAAILLLNAGEALMLSASSFGNFDDTIGEPIMPGMLLFLIGGVAYVAALMNLVITAPQRDPAE